MIFDCTMFFSEWDLLEIRLATLGHVVDYFVIAEADRTHQNNPKPFLIPDSGVYQRWSSKIIHVPVVMPQYNGNPWEFEQHQRNGVMETIQQMALPGDTIIVGDLDEIPRPEVVAKMDGFERGKVCMEHLSCYWLNYRCASPWPGTVILPWSEMQKISGSDLEPRYHGTAVGVRVKRNTFSGIPDAGWHFSYLGGVDAIIHKIKNFAHGEYNSAYWLDPERIMERIKVGCDPFERGGMVRLLRPVPVNELPPYVVENEERFKHLIYHDSND